MRNSKKGVSARVMAIIMSVTLAGGVVAPMQANANVNVPVIAAETTTDSEVKETVKAIIGDAATPGFGTIHFYIKNLQKNVDANRYTRENEAIIKALVEKAEKFVADANAETTEEAAREIQMELSNAALGGVALGITKEAFSQKIADIKKEVGEDSNVYENGTWTSYQEALAAAEAEVLKDNYTNTDAAPVYNQLIDAFAGLITKSALETKITAITTEVGESGDSYSETSWQAYQAALKDAQDYAKLADDEYNNEVASEKYEALFAAANKLISKEVQEVLDQVNALIKKVEDKQDNFYVGDKLQTAKTAVEEAKAFVASVDKTTEKSKVEEAKTKLEAADALSGIDKNELEAMITEATKDVKEQAGYEEATWTAYDTALKAVQAFVSAETYDKDQAAVKYHELVDAVGKLEEKTTTPGEGEDDVQDSVTTEQLIAYYNFENAEETTVPNAVEGATTYNGALSGAVSVSDNTDKKDVLGKSLVFDGTNVNSGMKIEDIVNTAKKSYSISMWYKYNDSSATAVPNDVNLLQQTDGGKNLLALKSSGVYNTYVGGSNVASVKTVEINKWQHITYTYNAETDKVQYYINGEADGEKDAGNGVDELTDLWIGRHKNDNSGAAMKGFIDEIRVYERVVTADEALAIYNEKADAINGSTSGDGDETVAVTSVTLDKTTAEVEAGSTVKLNATVKPDNATNKTVEWTTSDAEIATVSADGTVTGVKAGTATITAKAGEKTATCTVTVKAKPAGEETVAVTEVKLNMETAELKVGETVDLVATVTPDNATDKEVTWTVEGDAVSVEDGKVTAVKEGEATVTATAGGKSASCVVTVTAAEGGDQGGDQGGENEGDKTEITYTSITVTPETIVDLEVGSTGTLGTEVSFSAPQGTEVKEHPFVWSTSDEKVVTVDPATGAFKAVGAGTATLTVTVGGVSASCTITVKDTKAEQAEKEKAEAEAAAKAEAEALATAKKDATTFLDSVKGLVKESYSAETWTAYETALNKLTALMSSSTAKSSEITAAKAAVEKAKAALKAAPVVTPPSDTKTAHKKGATLKVKDVEYKVTKAGLTGGEVAFKKYKGTGKSCKIPATVKVEGITYKVTSIQKNAFKGNKTLTKITVGNNVTNIGNNAFQKCQKLQKVTIGKGVTKLGKNVFKNSKALKNITFKTTKLTDKGVAKKAFAGIGAKVKVKVPKKQKAAYKKFFAKKGLNKAIKL